MLNYNEIKILIESNNSTIKEVAEQVGLTSTGLKRSIENETMGIGTLNELLPILGITAAQFFDEEKIEASTVSISKIGNNNTIAGRVGSVVNGSESEVQFLRQQVRQLTEMNRDLIKTMKK